MVPAAWWFRHRSAELIRRLRDPRWSLILAVTPDREGLQSRVWPADLTRVPQGRGDLGTRMVALLRNLGPGPVMIVGSDIPGLRRHHVARALRRLRRSEAVFGPAPDGGFWVVGWRGPPPPPEMFRNVRWSTEHALADSVATLRGCRIAYADVLADVDTAADLRVTHGFDMTPSASRDSRNP